MGKRIAILGSTGSIGRSALRVIEALGPDYQVVALSAHRNVELLSQQCRKWQPKYVAVTDESCVDVFDTSTANGSTFLCGADSLVEVAASADVDILLTAVVGAAGLPAVLAAAQAGKTLAIANKEPLVVAGELLMQTARESGAVILPVDSEHSAVFQCLQSGKSDEVNRIVLTGSGGPFRTTSIEEMQRATRKQALNHPTWDMGPKITIDSATLMNKALEVIEASWLFDISVEQIDVVIHPESIIHSMVEFVDGSVIAQLSTTDMCLPIQYALTYPQRVSGITQHLKLEEMGQLTFAKPDTAKFRSLSLGYEVARLGGSAPVVFNAANEAAVEAFLNEQISFGKIVDLIAQCVHAHQAHSCPSLEELLDADAWARRWIAETLPSRTESRNELIDQHKR